MDNTKITNNIDKDMFEFTNKGEFIHDEKLSTKSRGFFADALVRFKKNKSSVVAAFIIAFLVIFAIISPIISPYSIYDNTVEAPFKNTPPFIRQIADLNIGLFDGGQNLESQNEAGLLKMKAIGIETGHDPIIKITGEKTVKEKVRGKWVEKKYYSLKVNAYYRTGIVYRTLSAQDFNKIQAYSIENDIQIIYPYVEPSAILKINNQPNIWYKVTDASKGIPKLDEDGNFIPVYSTNTAKVGKGTDYSEGKIKRIASDDGSYIYSYEKDGSVQCRISLYDYYSYVYGREPMFIFGTIETGHCLFDAIGMGARFSLIFAVIVAAINLTIGAIYGSIEGYFGGTIDLALERFSDILSAVPTIVVITLFQFYFAESMDGALIPFVLAYIMTGWIGMAALTRKQFYRFKGQEYVLAARTLGASDMRLMFKHIFPNSLGTIITSCALVIPGVIGGETSLTYLGIINLSEVSGTTLGVLMEMGNRAMERAPHAMLFPALFFALLMISFNLFGNGLRDAFNPSTRGVED